MFPNFRKREEKIPKENEKHSLVSTNTDLALKMSNQDLTHT